MKTKQNKTKAKCHNASAVLTCNSMYYRLIACTVYFVREKRNVTKIDVIENGREKWRGYQPINNLNTKLKY